MVTSKARILFRTASGRLSHICRMQAIPYLDRSVCIFRSVWFSLLADTIPTWGWKFGKVTRCQLCGWQPMTSLCASRARTSHFRQRTSYMPALWKSHQMLQLKYCGNYILPSVLNIKQQVLFKWLIWQVIFLSIAC